MHPNTPRRMGILKTIKNFLFDLDENLLLKLILEVTLNLFILLFIKLLFYYENSKFF